MRGQQKLFNNIFLSKMEVTTPDNKPRNVFMPERNEALYHRYYYYVDIKRMRFDDALNQLEKEFFITNFQIRKLLTKQTDRISDLHSKKTSIKELKIKYPFFIW
jgi:hypothetical protein